MLLKTITEAGRIAVGHPTQDPPNLAELLEADAIEHEALGRLELAYRPPEFSAPAAVWASGILYRCCQYLVYRDIGADTVRQTLAQDLPATPSPSVCYSVDLAFRHVPEVLGLARGIPAEDPLVVGLRHLAQVWPLSSVGIAGLLDLDLSGFIGHPCLRELYLDRIILRRDRSRLTHPQVTAALREALGAYPALAGEWAVPASQSLSSPQEPL